MTNITVRFYRERGLYAWLIRLWTRSAYAHCDLMIGPPGSPAALLNVRVDSGVTLVLVRMDTLNPADLEVPLTVDLDALMNFAQLEFGSGYDWWGILLSQVAPLRREDPDRWFCSEMVAALLRAGGYAVPGRNCEYSPEGLRKLISS